MDNTQSSAFLALMYRMRFIDRWSLMRASRTESLAEHSLDVAFIAHMLAELGISRYGRTWDVARVVLLALYHDAPEIITGDLPTPIKHGYAAMEAAYAQVEAEARERMIATLPADVRASYQSVLGTQKHAQDVELLRVVHAADKIAALIMCIEEEHMGNTDFATAHTSIAAQLENLAAELPEVRDFMIECLPSFGKTLDQLM